jgi:Arc/MetJ family transcription regulator
MSSEAERSAEQEVVGSRFFRGQEEQGEEQSETSDDSGEVRAAYSFDISDKLVEFVLGGAD